MQMPLLPCDSSGKPLGQFCSDRCLMCKCMFFGFLLCFHVLVVFVNTLIGGNNDLLKPIKLVLKVVTCGHKIQLVTYHQCLSVPKIQAGPQFKLKQSMPHI